MTQRFFKKITTVDGVETLSFFLEEESETPLISYDLATVRQVREQEGDMAIAKALHTVLSVILKSPLTPEEIEFAVEDI